MDIIEERKASNLSPSTKEHIVKILAARAPARECVVYENTVETPDGSVLSYVGKSS